MPSLLAGSAALLFGVLLAPTPGWGARTLSDDQLRAAAPSALRFADVPPMVQARTKYIRDQNMAIALGKALFWDMQVGSGGDQSCASCHFHAGADPRSKNQISPGLNDQTPGADPQAFGVTPSGGGGPNYQLTAADFPFPKALNDIVSSQGVFLRQFTSFQAGGTDNCASVIDFFHKDGLNTRRVEPRNAPTVINAVFNHRNFWDGRANHIFNGVDPLGPRSFLMPGGNQRGIWVSTVPRGPAALVQPQIEESSLASQAVGPALSGFEMSCEARGFPDVGRKMIRLRALAAQRVSLTDSVLGAHVDATGMGLRQSYATLIRMAFKPELWDSRNPITIGGKSFTQMEANFSLFWGLAIQLYEATLVSAETLPFDRFALGDNAAMTEVQKEGLEIFLDSNRGNCIACHAGPEFTGAAVRFRAGANGEAVERMRMGDRNVALYDGGFYNIGVRGTLEDLGVGANLGNLPDGRPIPLSFSRQLTVGPLVDQFNRVPAAAEDDPTVPAGPAQPGERVAVDGAFKTPTLRNAALTAPYFHNGGHRTLEQVVRFYQTRGAAFFALDNIANLDADILEIRIAEDEVGPLVEFMQALSDDAVRYHRAPFDHPELRVSNGHPGSPLTPSPQRPLEATDSFLAVPEAGAGGYPAPFPNFLE